MAITLKRTIWPVGHGAFYTEQFFDENHNPIWTAVYDCGDNSTRFVDAPALIVSRVDEFLSSLTKLQNGKPIVDYVFISHFHGDHTNGLSYLLKNAVVRHLIIPQITLDIALEAELRDLSFMSAHDLNHYIVSRGILERIQNKIRNVYAKEEGLMGTQITQVAIASDDGYHENQMRDIGYEEDFIPNKISSGTPIPCSYINKIGTTEKWYYIPVNTECQNTLIDKIKADGALKDILEHGVINYRRLKEKLSDIDNVKKLKQIYSSEFGGNMNHSSMALYSGLNHLICYGDVSDVIFRKMTIKHSIYTHIQDSVKYLNPYYPIRSFPPKAPINCLYMGDFCLKNRQQAISNVSLLQKMLMPYWLLVGMQQVPHHGSYLNHTLTYYSWPKLCFVNQDIDEKNCVNPDLTKQEIEDSGSYFLKVTEQDSTKIECIYRI